MVEGEEELKSLLIKLKEESDNASLKLSIQEMKIMASSPITLANRWEKLEAVTDLICRW